MRIVYLLTSLGMGGAERQVVALAERIRARGHGVTLMTLKPPVAEEWPTSLPLVRLGISRSAASVPLGLRIARRLLREFAPQIIHSHGFHANMLARLLRLGACGIPVISTIHNVYEGDWTRMAAYRLTDPLAAWTTAVSAAAAERFVRLRAVPAAKCSVVTNGMDTAEFAVDQLRRAAVREAMGVSGEFVWLAAGRVVAAKDYPNLLRAFAALHGEMPHARLWIAGEATAAAMRDVTAASPAGHYSDAVRWLGLRRDMPALLDAVDGFVQASAWEGLPLSVGEAMAAEKPVVATDVGGVSELVGDAGLVVPAKDSPALAGAMLEAMRMSLPVRHALGRYARQRILEHFNMDRKATEWEELYCSVIAGTTGHRQHIA